MVYVKLFLIKQIKSYYSKNLDITYIYNAEYIENNNLEPTKEENNTRKEHNYHEYPVDKEALVNNIMLSIVCRVK